MSIKDPLAIFLAILTFISTLTGVVSTFVTYAQFRRETEARAAQQAGSVGRESDGSSLNSKVHPFSFALKSKFRMSVGFLVLAVILGVVWKGTNSGESNSQAGGTTVASGESTEDGQVNINNTQEFFDKQLYVSLNSTDYKGEPARYFASFTVGTADGKVKRIKGEEAGFIMEFQNFKVRLISVSGSDASFQVKKNGNPGAQ